MRATYNGIPFTAHGSVSWSEAYGSTPVIRTIYCAKESADLLADSVGIPATLSYEPGAGKPSVHVAGIYLLAIVPGTDAHTRGLFLADRRWKWPRQLVVKSYNVRRRSNEWRMSLSDGAPLELGALNRDVKFHVATLKDGGEVWKPSEIIEDVLKLVDPDATIQLDDMSKMDAQIEGMELQDSGDGAVNRALGFLPGFAVKVDRNDRIVVKYRLDGTEAAAAAAAEPWHQRRGAVLLVNRRAIRPAKVHVHFVREVELRFNFVGEDYTTTDGDEPLYIENVIPVPEIYVDYNGERYWRGTYMRMGDYLDAIDGEEHSNAPGPLTHDRICRWLASGGGTIKRLWIPDDNGAADLVWVGRIHKIFRHYRRTFRLLPPWRDRIFSVKAIRAGVIDWENAIRAPAECYCDWISKATQRGLFHANANPKAVEGWAVEGYDADLTDCEPSPIKVNVIDEDNGVFDLQPLGDYFGWRDGCVLGSPDYGVPLTAALVKKYGLGPAFWEHVSVDTDWNMGVILTCLEAAPNSIDRLHKHTVKADKAGEILGVSIGACTGPDAHIHVGAAGGWWTARFAWRDADADKIRGAFLGKGDYPKDLLLNREHIKHLAEAAAANFYADILDRHEGKVRTPLNPNLEVTGTLDRVSHIIDTRGKASTHATFAPAARETRPMWSLLPASVRAQLLRQVQP